jgi:hypothetical protein
MTSAPPDGAPDERDDDPDARPRGALWLTYRYRLAGDDTPAASGTIKAPSFLSAARRLVAGRLAGRLGASPAYLRLRAAGEEEVLLRVARPAHEAHAAPEVTVVPADAYRFEPPAGGRPGGGVGTRRAPPPAPRSDRRRRRPTHPPPAG